MPSYQMTYEVQNTVARQLRELFATPKGSLILDPDYGMDYSLIDTDAGFALDAVVFKENIRNQLRKYVPRINAEKAVITIKYETSIGHLYVDIDGILINISENPGGIRVERP